jgi:hypothetical protein
MVDATAGCVWGWLRPRRVDVPGAGQAGGLAKTGTAARRRAGATIQTCTVAGLAIYPVLQLLRELDPVPVRVVDVEQPHLAL